MTQSSILNDYNKIFNKHTLYKLYVIYYLNIYYNNK